MEKSFKQFSEEFSCLFLNTIKNDIIEDGIFSKIDILCEKYYNENSLFFLRVISDLFYKYINTNNHILVGILSVLSKIEYSKIFPVAMTIILSSINHKSIEVKDYALKAIEFWSLSESFSSLYLCKILINSLKNTEIKEPWMKLYVDDIIKDFELKLERMKI